MALLTCNNVTLGFGTQIVAHDISFEVNKGDFLCIVGQNGSGKSTLMRAILGLIPVKSGSIEFQQGFKRTHIGYLPQQTQAQRDFPASVHEVILSGCQNSMGLLPFYTKKQYEIAHSAMRRLDIEPLRNKSFKTLSGGQQQKVLLARALCAASDILLLDEPTAALDPIATADFYKVIKSLCDKDNMTVIMISHDIAQALNYSDYILHIDKTVEFFGKTKDYLSTHKAKAYIGENIDE